MAAGQGPSTKVDVELNEPSAWVAVGDDRDRQLDPSTFAIKAQNHFLDGPRRRHEKVDILEGHVAVGEPVIRLVDEPLECFVAANVATNRMM